MLLEPKITKFSLLAEVSQIVFSDCALEADAREDDLLLLSFSFDFLLITGELEILESKSKRLK